MHKFMLIVPRKADSFVNEDVRIGMNSMGFLGSLAVKSERDYQYLKNVLTPLKFLE